MPNIRISFGFCLAFLCYAVGELAYAAPKIIAVSGDLRRGTVTISGSGFGANRAVGTRDLEFLGGEGGAIESGRVGRDFARPGWNNNWGWRNLRYSDDTSHSGRKSLKASVDSLGGAYAAVNSYRLPSAVSAGDQLFLSYWVRFTKRGSGQWKMLRLSQAETVVDSGGDKHSAELVFFNWDSDKGDKQIVTNPGMGGPAEVSKCFVRGYPEIPGVWHRIDLDLKAGDVGRSNGEATLTKYLPGQPAVTEKITGLATHYARGANWRYVIWQNYFGNGVETANVWMEDVFLQHGTRARVEFCDSPTWDRRSHCEIQFPITWTNDMIKLNANTRALAGRGYLYVIDASGAVSRSYQVGRSGR